MCTVTIIPIEGGVRVACNRDELRTRSVALAPEIARFGDRQAILPRDPDGGGTWVAANDAGLVFTLLNVNRHPARSSVAKHPRSRGEIIPKMLACDSLDDVLLQVMMLDAAEFLPFRLLVVDGQELLEVLTCGNFLTPLRQPVHRELICRTSSGLGDDIVDGPRHELFREFFARRSDWRASRQDEFHRHSWPERTHVSVCMSRPDACTVSFTAIERRLDQVRLDYHQGPPDQLAESTSITLPLRAACGRGPDRPC